MRRAVGFVILGLSVLASCGSSDSDPLQPLHCCMIDTMCAKCHSSYCDSDWTPYRHLNDEAKCAGFIKDSFNCSFYADLSPPYYYATDAKKECEAR
jgi:hypothetical protein